VLREEKAALRAWTPGTPIGSSWHDQVCIAWQQHCRNSISV